MLIVVCSNLYDELAQYNHTIIGMRKSDYINDDTTKQSWGYFFHISCFEDYDKFFHFCLFDYTPAMW